MPVADVLADGEPGDVPPRAGLGDAIREGTDNGDELHLPVDGVAGDLDVVERTGQRRGKLREGGGHIRHDHAGLFSVAAVVDADGEHLPWSGHRIAQRGLHERSACRC